MPELLFDIFGLSPTVTDRKIQALIYLQAIINQDLPLPSYLQQAISQEPQTSFCSCLNSWKAYLKFFNLVYWKLDKPKQVESDQHLFLQISDSGPRSYSCDCCHQPFASAKSLLTPPCIPKLSCKRSSDQERHILPLIEQPRPRRLNNHLHCCIEAPSPTKINSKTSTLVCHNF